MGRGGTFSTVGISPRLHPETRSPVACVRTQVTAGRIRGWMLSGWLLGPDW